VRSIASRYIAIVAFGLSGSVGAFAGVYLGTADCSLAAGCAPAEVWDAPPGSIVNHTGITYPVTFVANGVSSPNVKICVEDPFDGKLTAAVAWAIDKWNGLQPTVHNCANCLSEEAFFAGAVGVLGTANNLPSVVLHELGHCAIGLGHPQLIIDTDDPDNCTSNPPPPPLTCREITSFTVSYGGSSNFMGLLDGADDVRGSKDDTQEAQGPGLATNVHWFRRSDNDPVIIDSTVIDSQTYSAGVAFGDLPVGSSYSANANLGVSRLLGDVNTVSVMKTTLTHGVGFFGLSADDVNMVKMSRTGLNRLVGGTPNDDHAIALELVSCSSAHDIKVNTADLGAGVGGRCASLVVFVDPNDNPANAKNYKVYVPSITLNSSPSIWDFGAPMFYGHFDEGHFNDWDAVQP
jgi:hypothetical protein